jgi:GNAT superfamily N-acetyltransferase
MPHVRPATPADADALFGLTCAFALSFAPDRIAFERSLGQLLARDDAHLIVAELDGRVAGYLLGFTHLTLYANGPVGWVEEVMVDPSARRRGIGRMLIGDFEAWAQSRGASYVSLATRRAGPFYRALGYEESAVYYRKITRREP